MPDTSDAHIIAADKTEDTARRGRGDNKFLAWAWGIGAAIFGWLAVPRDYRNFTWDDLFGLGAVSALGTGVITYCLSWKFSGRKPKEQAEQNGNRLYRIVTVVLPVIFLLLAVATLFLTLATFNGDWIEARQGLFTVFTALIAAAGAFVSVVVSYQISEENRKLQRELETKKQDAELIKNLNDRLHEVIARRYSSGDDKDTSGLVSASYFQLASLYKDWETLSKTSDLIALQKESQQRNILKLLFGVYQESDEKGPSDEKNSSDRSEVDIRTLNSVIQDIFPEVERKKNNVSTSAQTEETESKTPDGQQGAFDLSYLDLRGLDLSRRDLRGANLIGAHLEGKKTSLEGACLDDARLNHAHLGWANLRGADLGWANLRGADLAGANLRSAHLAGANLRSAHLAGANLSFARMAGANLMFARLDKASFFQGLVKNLQKPEVSSRIINQLKASAILPAKAELLKAKGFDQALVDQIIQAHEEEQAGKEE